MVIKLNKTAKANKLAVASLYDAGHVSIVPSVATLDNGGFMFSTYREMLTSLLKIDYNADAEYKVKPEDAIEVIPILSEDGKVRELKNREEYKIWLAKTSEKSGAARRYTA